MKVVLLNCFDTYNERVGLVCDFFKSQKYEVTIIQSDFSHSKKESMYEKREKHIYIETKPYLKNISIQRLVSHYYFSKDAMKITETILPDILYIILPPNTLAKFARMYKNNYPNVKLIFDIMDLWPETFPIPLFKKNILFKNWENIRNKNLKFADFVITECDLFLEKISSFLTTTRSRTNYLAKKEIIVTNNIVPNHQEINLAYLGSINNIIDINLIGKIINSLSKKYPVKLHIIGDGENRENLIETAINEGAVVAYHGKIYDAQQKKDILDQCHFGLNIMKKDVCVGLTMKSIDYFQYGLPLINNIPSDTEKIVTENLGGVNIINEIDYEKIIEYFNKINNDASIKQRIKEEIFNRYFSVSTFNENLNKIINEII